MKIFYLLLVCSFPQPKRNLASEILWLVEPRFDDLVDHDFPQNTPLRVKLRKVTGNFTRTKST